MNFLLIHGAYGSPDENWFPWLRDKLESMGHKVFVPKFPTPEGQSLEAWNKILNTYDKYFNENLILVGHSLGPTFILKKLEKLNAPVKACFFVAGFLHPIKNDDFDDINATFYEPKEGFNLDKIKQNCKQFFVYGSENDPYVPQSYGKEIAEKLGVELTFVKGAGHFNQGAGFTEFPLLLDDIKKVI